MIMREVLLCCCCCFRDESLVDFYCHPACEQSLEKARSTASGSGLCEIAVSTASKAATKQKKTKGASLVNPSSKRYIVHKKHDFLHSTSPLRTQPARKVA